MAVWPNGSRTEPSLSSPWGLSDDYDGFHWGTDWYGFKYNRAIAEAVVTKIAYNSFGDHRGGGGREVYYRLANGDVIVTYHNKLDVLVKVGQRLSEGQAFGIQSDTGEAYGVHNHTEVWKGGKRNRRVDPREYIKRLIGSTPAALSSQLVNEQEEDEMANNVKTAYYIRAADKKQMNMSFDPSSGFFSEFSSTSGSYNGRVLGMYGSTVNPLITESHAAEIKAALERVRAK